MVPARWRDLRRFLDLMDAGVRSRHVGGVAMGLVMEGTSTPSSPISPAPKIIMATWTSKWPVRRRHHRNADGYQGANVSTAILQEALEQARRGRLFILDKMYAAIAEPAPACAVRAAYLHHQYSDR